MEELSNIEKLFDEENNDNLILYDENDRETEFEQCAVIPLDEKVYAILKPVDEIEGVADDEALVFVIEEIEDEDMLVIVDDEELVTRVFEVYYDLLRENGIEVEE